MRSMAYPQTGRVPLGWKVTPPPTRVPKNWRPSEERRNWSLHVQAECGHLLLLNPSSVTKVSNSIQEDRLSYALMAGCSFHKPYEIISCQGIQIIFHAECDDPPSNFNGKPISGTQSSYYEGDIVYYNCDESKATVTNQRKALLQCSNHEWTDLNFQTETDFTCSVEGIKNLLQRCYPNFSPI